MSIERLKSSEDFTRLFKRGLRLSVKGAKLFYLRLPSYDGIRVGFALCHGYGNAVKRNASKRYSREAFRLLEPKLLRGYEMVLLVYPGEDSFYARRDKFIALFKKAMLWVDE